VSRRDDAGRRAEESAGLAIGVIGIPKTIDNDIHFIDRSFGFETSFSRRSNVIKSAHVEAKGAKNGRRIGQMHGSPLGLHRLPRRARLDRRPTSCSSPR